MTIKELKNRILLALYDRYKNNTKSSIQFDALCKEYSIVYDSKQQLSDAVRSLKNQNLVNAIFFVGDEGFIDNITPDGVQYVEENLLTDEDLAIDGLKDSDVLMNSGAKIDLDIEGEPSSNEDTITPKLKPESVSTAYTAKEQYKNIQDSSIEPCFGITALSECYLNQLDKIAEHTNDNFCMLGIFGPWGRGKTYFFQKIKELIVERTNKKAGKKLQKAQKRTNNKSTIKL